MKELHDKTNVELEEYRGGFELAKEEVAVKVAQVKQYQRQVEAYKLQVSAKML